MYFIEDETKVRFAAMLARKQIIVIQNKKSPKASSNAFKFIGADGYQKWDFTPMVAEVIDCNTYNSQSILRVSVKGIDAADIIARVLTKLNDDGLVRIQKKGHELYEEVRNLLATFYI